MISWMLMQGVCPMLFIFFIKFFIILYIEGWGMSKVESCRQKWLIYFHVSACISSSLREMAFFQKNYPGLVRSHLTKPSFFK